MPNVNIQKFLKQTYHYLIDVLKTDSFLKVIMKNGNIVVMSEQKYDSLIQVLLDKNNKT